MPSAHLLNELSAWDKFKKNRKGIEDMEQRQNRRLKYLTFMCDLDLKLARKVYAFDELNVWAKFRKNIHQIV